jgi:TonB-linked SusC/RagA family outer membrane protein
MKIYIYRIIIIIPLLLLMQQLRAQTKTVTGNVTDEKNNPLISATVTLQGKNITTITDAKGNFSINIPSKINQPALEISYIGFVSQIISLEDREFIKITLQTDEKFKLADVIVVGYGTSRKRDLTGAVTSIKRSDFENQPLTDVSQSLKGLAAGVAVSSSTGAPGADVKIRIRGISSILGSNAPLIVIDGIQSNININELNPNDVESVEILKDASATAIYGSRASNGVVLISTRKGTLNGTPKIEINSFVSFKKTTDRFDLLNATDYANLANKLTPGTYSADELDNFTKTNGTDWQKELAQTGVAQSHTVTVSGGNAGTTYLFSGNYVNETGVVINSDRQRYALRANIQTKVNDRLTIGLNLSGNQNNPRNISPYYTEVWDAVNWSPTEPIFLADGSYNKKDKIGSIRQNPYMILHESKGESRNFLGTAGANASFIILPGLTFNTLLGINISNNGFGFIANEFINPNIFAGQGASKSTFWQSSSTLNYQHTINVDNKFSLLAGFEQQKTEYQFLSANGSNFPTSSGGFYNLGLASSQSIGSSYSAEQLLSYFGRGTYSYKDRYLLTATYRADGSSKFKGDNKYSYFPSVGLAWRISEENFMKDSKIFDNLKIRGSWGITGNQAIGPYATLSLLSSANFTYGGTSSYGGYSIQGAANPNLKWEETKQTDVGIDAGILNSRISFTADYFERKTNGLLQAVPLPDYNGGGTVVKNVGNMENKGFELAVNATPVQNKNWYWNSSLNFSDIRNKITSLGDVTQIFPNPQEYYVFEKSTSHVVQVGESLGAFWGVNHLGIWQKSEAAEAASYGNVPGDNKYQDLNGDKIIDGKDFQIIGNSLPKYRWGFNNTVRYNNFTLNVLVEAVTGYKAFNGQFASAATPSTGQARAITLAEAADFWTDKNQGAKYANPMSSSSQNFVQSSQWLQDGSFVRLKNISLAYDIKKSVIKFADMRIVVSGQNLLTKKKFVGTDPEGSVSGSSDSFGGYSAGVYPSAKMYTVGILFTY